MEQLKEPIYLKYSQDEDPVEVLEGAAHEHGDHHAFILVPAALWNRLKIRPAALEPEQMYLFK